MALRDLLLPALWIAAWLGNDYVWRGNRITASPGNDGWVGHIRRSGATRTYVEIKRRFWQGV